MKWTLKLLLSVAASSFLVAAEVCQVMAQQSVLVQSAAHPVGTQPSPVVLSLGDAGGVSSQHPVQEPTEPLQSAALSDLTTVATVEGTQPASGPSQEGTVASPMVATIAASSAHAEEQLAAMRGAYKGVFYQNDFGYLLSPDYSGPMYPGDRFKQRLDGRWDMGGEWRTRYHDEHNIRGFGLTGVDDSFWLSRLRMFASLQMTQRLRFYGEYLYADSGGETFGPGAGQRPIEENRGEAQNLFLDVTLLDNGCSTVSGRFGRQELMLGAQRLVSPLDWANSRRTFDGYRLTLSRDTTALDVFYTNPVQRSFATGGFNEWDSSNNDQHFFGTYWSGQREGGGPLEAYYLAFLDDVQDFSFHTLGSRVAGKGDFLSYEWEGGYQFGRNSDGSNHSSAFMTAGLGRQMDLCLLGTPWRPSLWAWYDWAGGGDSSLIGAGDDSFHHYFPLAHKYNGFMDLFGRRNLHDINFQFTAPVTKKLDFLVWYHVFFLDQATTPYSVTMSPFNTGNPAVSRDLGQEIDFVATYNVNDRNSVQLGYSFFNSGAYYNTPGSPTSANADFMYFQYQVRF